MRQSVSARFWMVPFNTGWHLALHVDIGVPFSKLPRLQAELERSGYVQPGLEWPTYRSLWRHASSRPDEATQGATKGSVSPRRSRRQPARS